MTIDAQVITFWPRWMETVGAMARLRVLVRSRCCKCEALLRVEVADLVARFGAGHSLIDRVERCRMIGCDGSAVYLASRSYGQEWTLLARDAALVEMAACPLR